MKDGYRAWYMNLRADLKMMSISEFVAYYDRSEENEATINDLINKTDMLKHIDQRRCIVLGGTQKSNQLAATSFTHRQHCL